MKGLEREIAEEIRWDVAVILKNSKPPIANLSSDEKSTLNALKDDVSRIIHPADKRNATVLMDIKRRVCLRKLETLAENCYIYRKRS